MAEDAELSNDTAAIRGHHPSTPFNRRRSDKRRFTTHLLKTFSQRTISTPFVHTCWNTEGTGAMQPRRQDNQAFVNRRYNLVDDRSRIVRASSVLPSRTQTLERALFAKFYSNASEDLIQRAQDTVANFEFVYCEADRFQNIHVDIPPKLMSFVFYIPERPVSKKEEELNATVLYDKTLQPRYSARFRAN